MQKLYRSGRRVLHFPIGYFSADPGPGTGPWRPVDLVLNDQRRAFSDEYINCILAARECFIELSARNPLAALTGIEPEDLKSYCCILVASPGQQENEKNYYQEIVGIKGDIQFADSLEEARLLAAGGQGFVPVEGAANASGAAAALQRVRLIRNGKPMKKNYGAFWKVDNSNGYVESFSEILKAKFT